MGRLLVAALAGALAGSPAVAGDGPVPELNERGGALAQALPSAAAWDFDDDERRDIHFAPFLIDGVRLDALDDRTRGLVDELLAVTLSRTGVQRVADVRQLETAVHRADGNAFVEWITGGFRDPGRYYVALFGVPGEGAWGYRLEGHHLSLNVTVPAKGELPAVTPLFLGAQPRVVPEGWQNGGLQLLREEEARARELAASLDDTQRAAAALPYRPDRGHMLSQVRHAAPGEPVGVRRADLAAAQQALLDGVVELYLANFRAEIADAWRASLDAAGRAEMRFAWAEAREPAFSFYYRIEGPTFRLEFDNTEDGDHIHAVLRSFPGDFGADLLAEHYARHH